MIWAQFFNDCNFVIQTASFGYNIKIGAFHIILQIQMVCIYS